MDLNSSAFVAPPNWSVLPAPARLSSSVLVDRHLFRQGDDPTGPFVLLSGRATMILENLPNGFEVVHELEAPDHSWACRPSSATGPTP